MDDYTPEPEPLLFGEQPSLTLGTRIGSSLRDASSSQWRPLDLLLSPPNRSSELHSPPPPPAPSTRPSLLPLLSSRGVVRQSFMRRPASVSSASYLASRHRAADFEAQTQRLRDRARARDLLDYVRGPSRGETNAAGGSTPGQAPPESFARRESGPRSEDESDARVPTLSPALPPAPVPAHAHPHSSGPSHNTLRRVTSELSSLDRTIEAHRRELSAAREDFTARFRRGVSSFGSIHHRSPSPITITGPTSGSSAVAAHPQARESLRAALWGATPRDEEGLPTPRSLTPESGHRGYGA